MPRTSIPSRLLLLPAIECLGTVIPKRISFGQSTIRVLFLAGRVSSVLVELWPLIISVWQGTYQGNFIVRFQAESQLPSLE